MIDKQLDIFRLSLREIPSDVRGTVCFLCSFVFVLIYAYCSIFVVHFILPHYHHTMPTVKLNFVAVTSLNTQAVNLKGTFDISFAFNTSKCDDHTIFFMISRLRFGGLEMIILRLLQCGCLRLVKESIV
jgi:hypothetical protein